MSGLHTAAPGKINLCLFVGAARASGGRHALVSVMQAVDLCDEVTLSAGPAEGPRDFIRCSGVVGPNIAEGAIAVFRSHTGRTEPVAVAIAKSIPVAAGMAGGSADAGAVLRLLDAHFATALGDDVLRELAASLGADVPAQVRPGRHLATGAGEIVEALPAPVPYGVVVLPHAQPLSTAAVYREFDRLGLGRTGPDLGQRTAEVREHAGDLPERLVVNDLQGAAISLCPAIAENLQRMRAAGAELVLLAGSGPTVIGLTRTVAAARDVAAAVGEDAGAWASLVDPVVVGPHDAACTDPGGS